MFIPIERRMLILQIVEREVVLMKPKHQFISLNEENEFMVPNLEKKRNFYLNPYLSALKDEL